VAGNEKRKCAAAADAAVSKTLLIILLAFIAAISLWTPLAQPAIAARWFTLPNLFYLLPVPALVVIFSLYQWRCLNNP
jgi:cytochrome d ubiquinol oxidase subunit II